MHLTSLIIVLHVVAAAAWLAGVAIIATYGGHIRVAADASAERSVAIFGRLGRLSRAAALPGALLTLAAGIYLVADGNTSVSGNWWVGAGIGAWVVCFAGSTMSRGSECVRITKLAAEHGPDHDDVQWRMQRIVFLARGELVLLVVAFAVMVVQPS